MQPLLVLLSGRWNRRHLQDKEKKEVKKKKKKKKKFKSRTRFKNMRRHQMLHVKVVLV
jgi:hypothetical protein